jgi:hypothetical protein
MLKKKTNLLIKWWWKLVNKEGLCQTIIGAKYMGSKPVALIEHKQSNSPLWSDILEVNLFPLLLV